MNKAIRGMFDELPGVYELINRIVSLGLDVGWRKKAARLASAVVVPPTRIAPVWDGPVWLDVSTGTGEMAMHLSRLADCRPIVVATDFSLPMLKKARQKLGTEAPTRTTDERQKRRKAGNGTMNGLEYLTSPVASGPPRIVFAAADTGCLPFRDRSFELITISLATRNVTTSEEALLSCLREFHRVLKPGGWFVNMETSQPASPMVRGLFHAYVRGWLRPVAAAISRNKVAYSYLANTICSFYDADELRRMIESAGYVNVTATRLFMGVAAVHRAQRVR